MEVLAAGRNGDFEIRLLKSHEAFAACATKRTKFQNRIPFLHGPSFEGISPRDLSLSFSPSLPSSSPYPLFLPLAASKDLHFYCHSTRLKTRGYRGTHCIAHNLYLLVPLRWTLRCKHSPAPRRQVQARHLTNSSVI